MRATRPATDPVIATETSRNVQNSRVSAPAGMMPNTCPAARTAPAEAAAYASMTAVCPIPRVNEGRVPAPMRPRPHGGDGGADGEGLNQQADGGAGAVVGRQRHRVGDGRRSGELLQGRRRDGLAGGYELLDLSGGLLLNDGRE